MSRRRKNKKNKDKVPSSPIKRLLNEWSQKECGRFSGESNHLKCLSEYLEGEHTSLWTRDPDPLYEQSLVGPPKAEVYADIRRDIKSSSRFIREIILKRVRGNELPNDSTNQFLRFLCSVPDCCSRVLIFERYDAATKEELYGTFFDWAMSEESPCNVYSTCILGHLFKEDDQVMFWWEGAYKKLIGVTLARLNAMNSTFQSDPNSVCHGESESNDLPLSNVFGEWNLASPMKNTIKARLLVVFLRHIAGFEKMLPSMYSGGVLVEMSSWLCYDRHRDIRLTFDALRLLSKLLQRGVIYTEYIDPINWIDLLLSVPRPSFAVNMVSFCLHRLLIHEEFVNEVVLLPHDKLANLIELLLRVVKTCHTSAMSSAMLCLYYLVGRPLTFRIFEELDGLSHIVTTLGLKKDVLRERFDESFTESTTVTLLESTLIVLKSFLEQSLVNWSTSLADVDRTGLFTFPIENKCQFSTDALRAIPLAMKLQTWSHPYILDGNVLKIMFATDGILSDTSYQSDEFSDMLDILSLLFLSNVTVLDFQALKDGVTDTLWRRIHYEIDKQHRLVKNVRTIRSIFLFLSVLSCRPLQDSTTTEATNNPTRKRHFSDIGRGHVSVKIDSCTAPIGHNPVQSLNTKLWNIILGHDVIPGVLNVVNQALSPAYDLSESIWICTWICHLLSGLSRSGHFSFILQKYPVFKIGYLESRLLESDIADKMIQYAELCSTSLRFFDALPASFKMTKPVSVLNYLTKRERESTSHSHHSRMVRHCVRQNLAPHFKFHENEALQDDKFTEHFCFAKYLDEGLFFVTKGQGISFIGLNKFQTPVVIGQIYNSPSNVENTKDGKLLMVSSCGESQWKKLTLFDVENRLEYPFSNHIRHQYPYCGYTEFSKTNDEKIVVTESSLFYVVDVETGSAVFSVVHSEMDVENRATFSYDDNVLLSCSSLWDVRCSSSDGAMIHKFDCLGNGSSGVFHPNRHDVIIGNAVWDVRTYRLIQTVPSIHSSRISFFDEGDFFYSYNSDLGHRRNVLECYNSRYYTSVMSLRIKGRLMKLAVDPTGSYVACIAHDYLGQSDNGRLCSVFNVGCNWAGSSRSSSPYGGYEDDFEEADADYDRSRVSLMDDSGWTSPDTDSSSIANDYRVGTPEFAYFNRF